RPPAPAQASAPGLSSAVGVRWSAGRPATHGRDSPTRHQPRLHERDIPSIADDDVIEDRDPHHPAGFGELPGDRPVLGRGERVAGRVVVPEDEGGRVLDAGGLEGLARVDDGRVERAAGDEDLPQDRMLRVEQEDAELLLRRVPQRRRAPLVDIAGPTDPGPLLGFLACEPAAELESGRQPRGDGPPDPTDPDELAPRAGGGAPERAVALAEKLARDRNRGSALGPAPDQDGEQLPDRECTRPGRPEPLPRPLGYRPLLDAIDVHAPRIAGGAGRGNAGSGHGRG